VEVFGRGDEFVAVDLIETGSHEHRHMPRRHVMTTQQGATAPMSPQTGGDHRRQIATYANYSDAERAVDYLSDNGFPVQRVAIVGSDVQLVEQVVGRLNYGGAALRGAGSGAFTGLLIGWLFGLFNWFTPVLAAFSLALYGLVFGAVFGALFGLVMHASQRGRRDFASISVMRPSRYELHVDAEVADRAKDMLAKLDGGA
jgi:heat induced stress protein YflT